LSSTVRPFPLLLALSVAACGGAQGPPPPVSTPAPRAADDGLRPLASHERGSTAPSPAAGSSAPPAAPTPELPPGHPPIAGMAPGQATSAGTISGTIAVSPKLASSLAPRDVLYVMAKKDGSTLAVRRVDSPSFPFAFEITAGDAMVAGVAFAGPVDVVARLSKTGDAIAAPGDLEGTTKGVAVPANGVKVMIDRVRE
jgi:cytochrome c-type biogenesis protein CcmH